MVRLFIGIALLLPPAAAPHPKTVIAMTAPA
jgi:hypothetical protein